MRFEEKLKKNSSAELWGEYCGFLELDIQQFMHIQRRLMEEQIGLWSASGLGQRLLKGQTPRSFDEFRQALPLTTYADYADVLLQKQSHLLPGDPVIWIQTTWEGGKHPIKIAPYTQSMLNTYRANVIAILMLSTSFEKGRFNLSPRMRALYGCAPLPYATGILPLLLDEEIKINFLPPASEAVKMSFGERNRKGFAMGLHEGIDLFFGVSSVANYITESFESSVKKGGGGLKSAIGFAPSMLVRFLSARYKAKRDGRPLLPRDVFRLKGFVCAGTDSSAYRPSLESGWGVKPLMIAAGTEPTCIGTESWERNGLYFFPDACFYEFIPESEMNKNAANPSYQPKTCLLDEVSAHQNYELALTVFKGGAFARYRVGDMYRCISLGGLSDTVKLPRFELIDRVPSVIDIAGFTRITQNSIEEIIRLSGLAIDDWIAKKEFTDTGRPFLHMYVEIASRVIERQATDLEVLTSHFSTYFKYMDSDYHDLKRLLGVEPLKISLLRHGAVRDYEEKTGQKLRRINPTDFELAQLLKFQSM